MANLLPPDRHPKSGLSVEHERACETPSLIVNLSRQTSYLSPAKSLVVFVTIISVSGSYYHHRALFVIGWVSFPVQSKDTVRSLTHLYWPHTRLSEAH